MFLHLLPRGGGVSVLLVSHPSFLFQRANSGQPGGSRKAGMVRTPREHPRGGGHWGRHLRCGDRVWMLLYAPTESLKTTECRHFRSTRATRMPWTLLDYVNEMSRDTYHDSIFSLSPLPGWPLHAASTPHCKVAANASFMSNGRDQHPHIVIKCSEIHLRLDFMKMFKLMSVASRLAHGRWRQWSWLWGKTSQDPATPLQKSGDGRREGGTHWCSWAGRCDSFVLQLLKVATLKTKGFHRRVI